MSRNFKISYIHKNSPIIPWIFFKISKVIDHGLWIIPIERQGHCKLVTGYALLRLVLKVVQLANVGFIACMNHV